MLGPDYRRPDVAPPPQYRADPSATPGPESLAAVKWFDLFQDDRLRDLIRTALEQNYDLRIAAARVLEARARLGISRSELFPTVDGGGEAIYQRTAPKGANRLPPDVDPEKDIYRLGLGMTWEIDLWGRIRRLTESARADLLASEDVRRGVVVSLIGAVATAYFELRELDLELGIARQTLSTRERAVRITTARFDGGVATRLDVRQAENLYYSVATIIARLQRQIEQKENEISLLLARDPGPVARGLALEAQPVPPAVPPGLPSALLERRPDIRAAEQQLVSANAQIGAAVALYFPRISLTGVLGLESRDLGDLFRQDSLLWSIAGGASVPIFNAGRIRSTVDVTEARTQQALVSYEATVRTAFREVSDALVGIRKAREERQEQERVVTALADARRLAFVRYQGGLDTFLPVLDADSRLFEAELALAQLRRNELLSVVALYRALGGGWES